MNFLDLIANDLNVAPAFRRIFAEPKKDVLEVAHDKAAPRRFTGEPLTGFGGLSDERLAEIRAEETDCQREDERREREERGE